MAEKFIGVVYPFTPGDCIETYLEHMGHLFKLNKYNDDDTKKSFLVTAIGIDNFKILTNLLKPAKMDDKKYDDLVKCLIKHFKPTPNEISESYKFYKRLQRPEESISDYMIELKLLSNSCNFGDFRDRALRDALVIGIRSDDIRQKLLNSGDGETSLTLSKALEIATNSEMTHNNVKLMKPEAQYTNSVRGSRKDSSHQKKSSRSNSRSLYRSKSRSKFNSSNNSNTHSNKQGIKCFACNGYNHYARDCTNKKPGSHDSRNSKVSNISEKVNNLSINSIHSVENDGSALYLEIIIEGIAVKFEYDPGACVSLMSEKQFKKLFSGCKVQKYSKTLNVVTGDNVEVVGMSEVDVWNECESNWLKLNLVLIGTKRDFIPLLGRSWLDLLSPNWRNKCLGLFKSVNSNSEKLVSSVNESEKAKLISEIKEKYPSVFNKNLEEPIKHFSASIHIKEGVTPIFFKPYTVPYGLVDKVEVELDRLLKENIIEPVRHTKWASPIVVVEKSDGSIRMCVDCKVTVNKYIKTEHYPLPRVDDLLSNLAGLKVFSVLDLAGAYQQLEIDKTCRDLVNINTQRGLFRWNRLPFGVACAPSLFQETMDQILVGIKGVLCYLDDILIGGLDLNDCKNKVHEVMDRLSKYNVRVNERKCRFFLDKLKFLGFEISGVGIHPYKEKVVAILGAPCPTDITQLKSFLGLLNYYGRFIPNLSSELHVLYDLLKKDNDFDWTQECNEVFEKAKKLLLNNNLLVHYDPKLPIILSCDASPYGVGAILSHMIDGEEKPVFMVSSSLSPAEKNYSQLHREALAIIFGIKRFHKYLYGNKFTIYSDHQPLREIFSEKKGTPAVAAARLQRWAVLLSAYDYTIEWKKASMMAHADALSRLPLSDATGVDQGLINSFNEIGDVPIVNADVARETQCDPILKEVFKFINEGWPERFEDSEFKRWSVKKNMLSCENECLYFGNRLVVPNKLIPSILEILHKDHKGIVRMKALARSSLWWFGIDGDIEAFVKSCMVCMSTQKSEKQKVFCEWPKSSYPFERVHVDLFEFQKSMYLVFVDSYSKFINIDLVQQYNAFNVIEKLRILFAAYGLPKMLVSDNGPPFNSYIFKMFFKANGIEVLNSPPYHPESNGLAERAVQTSKNSFRKFVLDLEDNFQKYMLDPKNKRRSLQMMIDNFHMNYRNTPCTVTGLCPTELIFCYKPRTLIDLLRKDVNVNEDNQSKNNVSSKESNENLKSCLKSVNKKSKNFSRKVSFKKEGKYENTELNKNDQIHIRENKQFKVNEKIMYLNNFKDIVRWIPGIVKKQLSTIRYVVCVNGVTRAAHINQLKKIVERKNHFYRNETEVKSNKNNETFEQNTTQNIENNNEIIPEVEASSSNILNEDPVLRKSSRAKKKPDRLNL